MTNSELSTNLDNLAQRINTEHGAAHGAFTKGLGHAVKAGELLIEAKAKVEHGQWLPWLKKNCSVSERAAQLYMKVATGLPELEAKNASVADLTLRGAAQQLAESKPASYDHGPAAEDVTSPIFVTGPDDEDYELPIARNGSLIVGAFTPREKMSTAEEREKFAGWDVRNFVVAAFAFDLLVPHRILDHRTAALMTVARLDALDQFFNAPAGKPSRDATCRAVVDMVLQYAIGLYLRERRRREKNTTRKFFAEIIDHLSHRKGGAKFKLGLTGQGRVVALTGFLCAVHENFDAEYRDKFGCDFNAWIRTDAPRLFERMGPLHNVIGVPETGAEVVAALEKYFQDTLTSLRTAA